MNIETIFKKNPLILAPMAGITDYPFRRIARDAGAGLVCAEMVSANGLVYDSDKTHEMLFRTNDETPLSIQIFGANSDIMADAAAIVENAGADVIDINFGCSVKKILKSNSGSALMADLKLCERIIS
ncbi:MAG: tRNA dihydrouridine synthase DusB, partial [Deltaproteobacteria bacterium]|nr:tRNA dihydrouridine synthase DusB [Deltaproteobacteria bacterium]